MASRRTRQVRLLALGRVFVGGGLLARPLTLPRTLGVDTGSADRMAWLTRMLGVREVALGVGTLYATRGGAGGSDWIAAGAACDAVDVAVFAAAAARGRIRRIAGFGAALVGVAAVARQVAALRADAAD